RPVCPLTATGTAVPGGMFVPESVSVTGFAIGDGSVMSGMPKDAVGTAGVATPPMAVIVSVGPLASMTAEGGATDGATALTLTTALVGEPSGRGRATEPPPLPIPIALLPEPPPTPTPPAAPSI